MKAAAASYGRVFLAAALGTYIASGDTPFTLDGTDLRALISSGAAALALTVFNALRPGDTRFGAGADHGPA